MGTYSKSDAKKIILDLNLKPIDTYVSCVQRDYAKVMAEEKKPKPKRNKRIEIKPIIDIIIEPMAVEPESHEVVNEKENE
jgi:hypothetical protein